MNCFWIDLVNRIISEEKVKGNLDIVRKTYFEGLLGDVLRTSWGRPKSTSQDVRSRRPKDVTSGHTWGDQIGTLEDVLGTLDGDVIGTSWEPIFAGWEGSVCTILSRVESIQTYQEKSQTCCNSDLLVCIEKQITVFLTDLNLNIPARARCQLLLEAVNCYNIYKHL